MRLREAQAREAEGGRAVLAREPERRKRPEACKFPDATARHEILDAIEVIDTTAEARRSIEGVPPWRA